MSGSSDGKYEEKSGRIKTKNFIIIIILETIITTLIIFPHSHPVE